MKKIILSLILIFSNSTHTSTTNTQKSFLTIAPTLSWWRSPKRIILDTGGDKDYIQNNTSDPTVGFYCAVMRQVYFFPRKSIALRLGFQANIAKRKEALHTDYFDVDATTTDVEVRQDIKVFHLAPRFELCVTKPSVCVSTWIAPVLALKTIENFKTWEKSTNSYVGQRLKALNPSTFCHCGLTIDMHLNQNVSSSIGYSFLFGKISFEKKVIMETPDTTATQVYQDQLLFDDRDSIYLPKEPTIKYHAHTLHIGFSLLF